MNYLRVLPLSLTPTMEKANIKVCSLINQYMNLHESAINKESLPL